MFFNLFRISNREIKTNIACSFFLTQMFKIFSIDKFYRMCDFKSIINFILFFVIHAINTMLNKKFVLKKLININ